MTHVILNFHGIGEPAQEHERGESRYWIHPDLFLEILGRISHFKERVQISLTFDDGNASDLLVGAEGLARHQLRATFFVLADRIGKPDCLSARDMMDLIKMGHRIGNHGAAHVDWTQLDTAGFERELDLAREAITMAIGQPVTAAAIPFGRYSRRVLSELTRRSYNEVYSSDGGPVTSPQIPLPRTSLRRDMTIEEIDAILLGHEPRSRQVRRALSRLKKRWV